MKSRVLAAISTLAAGALVLAVATMAQGPGEVPHSPPPPGSGPRDGLGTLEVAAAEVADYWRRRSPETFAHVALDESGQRVMVYRLPSGTAVDREVRRRFPSVEMVFRDARRSETELQRLTAQVMRDVEFWRARDIEISSVGPKPEDGVVQVMTPDMERAHEALRSRYGDRVVVREGEWTRGPYTPSKPLNDPGER